MTARRDPDQLIHQFLLEGSERLDDQIYDAVRAAVDRKPQRVVIGPWRTRFMSKFLTLGLGAAAVVAALVVGTRLIAPSGPPGPGVVSSPSPTVSPSATTAPSVASTGTPDVFLPEGPFALPPSDGTAAITVTIPASGWSFLPEFGALAKGDDVDNLPEASILFAAWDPGTGFYVYGDPCRWRSTTPEVPATAVDAIAAALAAQVSRDASEPVDVTVGGHAGKAITVHVPDDANFSECEGGEFGSFGTEVDALDRYHQGPGQIDEFWLLDVDGSVVMIDAMYRPDTSAALIEEMRAIAASATFE